MLIGVPLVTLNIISLYIKHWDHKYVMWLLLKNDDIKLILLNGKIIRNMKKLGTNAINAAKEVVAAAEPKITMGLVHSPKGPHAFALNKDGGRHQGGILYTSKRQKDDLIISQQLNSYGYAQVFDKDNTIVEMDEIRNVGLRDLLEEEGRIGAIAANMKLMDTTSSIVRYNTNNKQVYINLGEEVKKESSNFINSCGGREKVNKALLVAKHYEESIKDANELIYRMSNCTPEEKVKIFNQNRAAYDNLKALREDDLGELKNGLILARLTKIEDLINM